MRTREIILPHPDDFRCQNPRHEVSANSRRLIGLHGGQLRNGDVSVKSDVTARCLLKVFPLIERQNSA
jgi:hypothetical protein